MTFTWSRVSEDDEAAGRESAEEAIPFPIRSDATVTKWPAARTRGTLSRGWRAAARASGGKFAIGGSEVRSSASRTVMVEPPPPEALGATRRALMPRDRPASVTARIALVVEHVSCARPSSFRTRTWRSAKQAVMGGGSHDGLARDREAGQAAADGSPAAPVPASTSSKRCVGLSSRSPGRPTRDITRSSPHWRLWRTRLGCRATPEPGPPVQPDGPGSESGSRLT
jgi:hypothetical protein